MDEIPALPGSYALHLHLHRPMHLRVGKLGIFGFPAGDYLYLGSAHGPGGLRARLGRHLNGGQRHHWHIDALRTHCLVRGYYFVPGMAPLECEWSTRLSRLPGAAHPAVGFGASDCSNNCQSHLIHLGGMICPGTDGVVCDITALSTFLGADLGLQVTYPIYQIYTIQGEIGTPVE